MRKLCPNYDREDGLDTVLEVPIPEEMFSNNGHSSGRSWKAWMRAQVEKPAITQMPNVGGHNIELQLLLGVIGAPLVPLRICSNQSFTQDIKSHPMETSMAKYIVQQYMAASGGEKVLSSIDSMYAMGKVKMTASNQLQADEQKSGSGRGKGGGKVKKLQDEEVGSFVLWQKRPELWCLELVVSGCKISAGSDGKVAWRQTPWHQSHASRGPPRPLRRLLQGLDPMSTANLFSTATCVGEKTIDGEDCFLLKLDAEPSTLKARSGNNVEIIRHTVWGYFSQRTGLLVHFEDSHLLQIIAAGNTSVYWETTMTSSIKDYRIVDGVNIAHSGKSVVSLFRFGDDSESHNRTCMEETWSIEEVDFNIWGLSIDCFLPPRDLKKDDQDSGFELAQVRKKPNIPAMIPYMQGKIGPSKVAAVDIAEDSDSTTGDEEEGRL